MARKIQQTVAELLKDVDALDITPLQAAIRRVEMGLRTASREKSAWSRAQFHYHRNMSFLGGACLIDDSAPANPPVIEKEHLVFLRAGHEVLRAVRS